MLRSLLFTALFVGAALCVPLPGQAPVQLPEQASEISVASLQARLDAINADSSLAADMKTLIAEALGRAIEHAKAAAARQQAAQRYAQQRVSAPERLTQRKTELQALDQHKPGPRTPDMTLAELEQGLAAAQQAQTDAQKQATDLDGERTHRAERRTAVPAQLGHAKAQLDALPAQPVAPPDADSRLQAARRLALLAERAHWQAEIDALGAELQAYDAETELLRVEGDLTARRATVTKADTEAWLAVLQPMRVAEAQRAEREASEARQRTMLANPGVAHLADGNSELARALLTLAEQREAAEREKALRERERVRLQKDFDEVKRVDVVGSTNAIGAMLRQRRTQLADTNRQLQQRLRSRADRIADAHLRCFEFDELRRRLVEDPEAWLQAELGTDTVDTVVPAVVLEEARRLRDARRDLLQQLCDGYSSLLNTEIDVESSGRQLADVTSRYRSFVAERVLGIPSSQPLWQSDIPALTACLGWFLDAAKWRDTARVLVVGMFTDVWPILLVGVLTVLLGMSRWLHRRLRAHGELAARGSTVAYSPTARAAIDTVLLATPLPALLWLCGARLAAHPECTDFGKALANGATTTAGALLIALLLRALVRPRGLAEAHFQWQSTTVAHLRRTIPLLVLSIVPFAFLVAAIETTGDDRWLGSLGALLLFAELSIVLVALWRLMHPTRGVIGGGVRTPKGMHRFRHLWFVLAIGVPLTQIAMVVLGYEYTVLHLSRRMRLTAGVIVVGVFVYAMIVRSLVLERRRLQIRRAQTRAEAAKVGESPAGTEPKPEDIDPQSLARQTQTLLRGAITIAVVIISFQAWIDVLPALGILRQIDLWSVATEPPTSVTLADLLLSLFILLTSLVAARNIPGLLELFVLQRLRMQAGERNAVTTLARYGVVIAGVVWSFSSIGIGWSKVQWLVAAVSVGLGFGLQEIFANFVSGLILLFERPVRVGDIVQVGTTTGRVTRIRIRATTIQDWDLKELIVPNREFVTREVVNWTLSDPTVRWTFPVGVAFGTDTEKAVRLLEKVAKEARFVLNSPPPEGVFVGFGENALNLQLRLYVDMHQLEYRWMTDLYQGIDRAFRDAGIEIAFPQRDVHLRLSEQIVDLLRQRATAE